MITAINEAINRKLASMSFTNIVNGIVESIDPLSIRINDRISIGLGFIEPKSLGISDDSPNPALPFIVGDKINMIRYNNGQRFYVLGVNSNENPDINNIDSIQFNLENTVTTAEGKLFWNKDDGTLNLGLANGSTLQLGQETVIRCRNDQGSTISNGQVVYINGSTGTFPKIKLANATTVSANYALGVATQSIKANQFGYVTIIGIVRDINTSAFTEGAQIWLGTTDGALSATKPTAPNMSVFIGYVIRVHANKGMIAIRTTVVPRLQQLSDIFGTPNNDQMPVWNSTNNRFEYKTLIDSFKSIGKLPTGNGSFAYWQSLAPGNYFALQGVVTAGSGQPSGYGFVIKYAASTGTTDMRILWYAQKNGACYELGLNGTSETLTTASWKKVVYASDILNMTYPVGAIYQSTVSINPATLFGGTWIQVKDRFLIGAGGSYSAGSTGGEANHTLTQNEMPIHSHSQRVQNNSGFSGVDGQEAGAGWAGNYHYANSNSNEGGDQPHNNMPPYRAVYMWYRSA